VRTGTLKLRRPAQGARQPGHVPAARHCAELLGLATFMRAVGIGCSQRLGDLVTGLEPGGEADAVRLLGAARRP
jgi:hypothetical protein